MTTHLNQNHAELAQAAPVPLLKGTAEKILHLQRWTERLFSFRLSRPAAFRFQPGQFARLGLDGPLGSTIWRPYSMVSAAYDEHLDFFSIQVPDGAFTSRLATCKVGDTVYVEKTAYGYLTTSRFVGGSNLWLLATGTGIAPFLSILRDPAVWVQYEHIVLAYSVRQAADLAYRDEIAALPQHPLWAEQGTSCASFRSSRGNSCRARFATSGPRHHRRQPGNRSPIGAGRRFPHPALR